MRTLFQRISTITIIAWCAALPVFAQTGCGAGGTCLDNPLRFPNIERFIEGVLQAVVMIALPVITVFIVYAGFKYIFARGKPGEISKAHENFKYVIIGTILILSAWVLATLIGGTITQLLGN